MLKITVGPIEDLYNPKTDTFKDLPERTLHFEHCLKAIFRWEGKYNKPFLSDKQKTDIEIFDYLRMMCLDDEDLDPCYMTQEVVTILVEYMKKSPGVKRVQKAGKGKSKGRRISSSEDIYANLASAQMEKCYDEIHIERLLRILESIAEANDPKSKKNNTKNTALSMARHNSAFKKAHGL